MSCSTAKRLCFKAEVQGWSNGVKFWYVGWNRCSPTRYCEKNGYSLRGNPIKKRPERGKNFGNSNDVLWRYFRCACDKRNHKWRDFIDFTQKYILPIVVESDNEIVYRLVLLLPPAIEFSSFKDCVSAFHEVFSNLSLTVWYFFAFSLLSPNDWKILSAFLPWSIRISVVLACLHILAAMKVGTIIWAP